MLLVENEGGKCALCVGGSDESMEFEDECWLIEDGIVDSNVLEVKSPCLTCSKDTISGIELAEFEGSGADIGLDPLSAVRKGVSEDVSPPGVALLMLAGTSKGRATM